MKSTQDQFLYEEVESTIRNSIPNISKNIHNTLNEWTIGQKIGLFGKEIHNKILDAAHRLNFASNFADKKEAQRIKDELLTSHYASALGMKKKNITNILNYLPANDPDRISLEAKIKTLGKVNPVIGSLERSSNRTISNYGTKASKSYAVLRGSRSPARMANIYRYLRKNPGLRNAVIP